MNKAAGSIQVIEDNIITILDDLVIGEGMLELDASIVIAYASQEIGQSFLRELKTIFLEIIQHFIRVESALSHVESHLKTVVKLFPLEQQLRLHIFFQLSIGGCIQHTLFLCLLSRLVSFLLIRNHELSIIGCDLTNPGND